MTAASAPNLAIWRAGQHSVEVYVFIHQPPIVFQAHVNLENPSYPVSSVTYDGVTFGAYTDIEDGQTLLIGTAAGLDDLGRVRVRRNANGVLATATTIKFSRSSRGRRHGEIHLQDDAYITVLDLRMIWATPPRITKTGVVYKDSDIVYDEDLAYPPIVNAGPDRLHVVPLDTDTQLFDFGQTPCETTNPAKVTGNLTYVWDFKDGTPSSSTSATPTDIEFPVGRRYISVTGTDEFGTEDTAYALIVVADENHPDLLRQFNITSHKERADGQSMALLVRDSIPADLYPLGTEVLAACYEYYANVQVFLSGLADCEQMIFAGWLASEDNQGDANRGDFVASTALTLLDNAGRLRESPQWKFLVERRSTPNDWFDMPGANVDLYQHHVLRWHSNALQRVDFAWSGTGETYAFPVFESEAGSAYDQFDVVSQAITYKLVCDPWGRLLSKADPILQETDERTSVKIVHIQASDWTNYKFSHIKHPRYHWLWAEALIAAAVNVRNLRKIKTVHVVAPGIAPGQGLQEQTSTRRIVTSLAQLARQEGHRYAARLNAEMGMLMINMARNGQIGIRPADMEWVTTDIPVENAGPRNRTYTTTDRFLPVEVSYTYDLKNGVRRSSLTLEQEVIGQPAKGYTPTQPNKTAVTNTVLPQLPSPSITIPTIVTVPPVPDYGTFGAGRLAALCSDGHIRRTPNFHVTTPIWQDVNIAADLSGTVLQWIVDAQNTDNGWLITNAGVDYVSNIFGVPSVENLLSLPASSLRNGDAHLDGQLIVVASNYTGIIRKTISLDKGQTWSTESAVDVNGAILSGTSSAPGVFVDPRNGRMYVPGRHVSTNQTAYMYWAEYGSNVWTRSLLPDDESYHAGFTIPYADDTRMRAFYAFTDLAFSAPDDNFLVRTTINQVPQPSILTLTINPVISTRNFGPDWTRSRFAIAIPSNDRNKLIYAGVDVSGLYRGILCTSDAEAATPTWTQVLVPATGVNYCRVAVDDGTHAAYVFGTNLAIGYVANPWGGGSIVSKKGAMSGSAEIVGIAG